MVCATVTPAVPVQVGVVPNTISPALLVAGGVYVVVVPLMGCADAGGVKAALFTELIDVYLASVVSRISSIKTSAFCEEVTCVPPNTKSSEVFVRSLPSILSR